MDLRYQVIRYGGFGLGIFCCLGLIIRNFVAPMKPIATMIALLIGASLLLIPYALKRGLSLRVCSFLILFAISALGLNAGIHNGGLRAPVATVVLFTPFFGFISSGRSGARIGALLGISIVSYFLFAECIGVEFPLLHPERYIYYKAVMTYFGIFVAYIIGWTYEKFRVTSEAKLLQLSSELSQASKMSSLGEMASGISHEINNPLSIIVAKAEILKKNMDAGAVSMEKIKDDLAMIEKNGRRISKIIQGMKRLSGNPDSDAKAKVFLSHVVEDVLEVCREKFRHHQVDLRWVDLAPGVEIECQSTQIAQVLLNLLGNAFDAVESLREKWVEIRMEARSDFLLLSVMDSGNGITMQVADKMMMPFYTTKPIGKGTGLGLSISKRIIESHGGELTYDAFSAHTRFNIKLPLFSITNVSS